MTEKKHTQDPLNVDEALSTSEAFLLKNKNLLLGIVAAIVVVVAGVLGYKHFISAPKELKAAEAIFKGEQYFAAFVYNVVIIAFAAVGTFIYSYRSILSVKRRRIIIFERYNCVAVNVNEAVFVTDILSS